MLPKCERSTNYTFLSAIILASLYFYTSAIVSSTPRDCYNRKYRRVNLIHDFQSETLYERFNKAAIVTNGAPCATISKGILLKGGNAVDAMIGALLCDGVTVPYSMGIGGGFFMLIYNKKHGNFSTIIARDQAPAAAHTTMFVENPILSKFGGLSIAIPGEMKGYWTAYQKFGGRISWREILSPTIKLCEEGIPVNRHLAARLIKTEALIRNDKDLSAIFIDPVTNRPFKEGDYYKNPALARTFKIISEYGGDVLYEGPLALILAKDIQEKKGIITDNDLKEYKVEIEEPFVAPIFENSMLYTVKPPSSGPILAYILRLVNGIMPFGDERFNTQRITEAFKFAFGLRMKLGDPKFVNTDQVTESILSDDYVNDMRENIKDCTTSNDPAYYEGNEEVSEDHGTANVAVLAENGDAVVATSTINLHFGSGVLSKNTGIILNDGMDDFSSPNITNAFNVTPSSSNYIEPGKRPLSSMCPAIVLDENRNVQLLLGAAGGTKIITATAQAIIRVMLMNETIKTAIDNSVFHHQLLPMEWQYDKTVSDIVVRSMSEIGHSVTKIETDAVLTGIHRTKKGIYASCSGRRMGQVDGF